MKLTWIVCIAFTLLSVSIICSEVNDIETALLSESDRNDNVPVISLVQESMDFKTAVIQLFVPGFVWTSLFAISSYLLATVLSTYEGRMFLLVGLEFCCLGSVLVLVLLACFERLGMFPEF